MSPRRSAPPNKQPSGLPSWVLPAVIAVIVVGVVLVGVDFISKINTTPPVPTTVTGGIVRSGKTEGDPGASIAFIEFSDFQ